MNEDKEEKKRAKKTGVGVTEREEGEVVKEEEKKLLHVAVASVRALNGTEAAQPVC